MTVNSRPERMLFNAPKNPDYHEMMELADKYRVLMGLSWHDFIVIGFASVVREDNDELADAFLRYVKNRRRAGRPKGQSVKAKLQRMGVDPNKVTPSYK